MSTLVFNRATDNYLFHGSEFRAGSSRDYLRLSTANRETVIDICNNFNIDISAADVFINGNKVVTSSGSSGSTLGSLEVTGSTVLQDLSAGATDISSTLNVAGATTLSSTLDVTGDTTLTGALGATTINASGAVGVDGDFDVATDKFTVASATGNTTVAGTLAVTGATTLTGALGATSINASGAVGVDGDFDVATDKFTVASATGNTAIAGTLAVTDKITVIGGLDISGHLLPTTPETQIPVTKSTFTLVKNSLGDLSGTNAQGGGTFIDSSGDSDFQDATNYTASRIVLSGDSCIKMEFKVNFISSPEADQTISFKVTRSINGGTASDVFTDSNIGSNMGVSIKNVYNGTFIDDLSESSVNNGDTVSYQLQYKRNCPTDDTISTNFGIVDGGNYIFLQELYVP